jgi:hypothetical protein
MPTDLAIRDNAPPNDPDWFGVAGSAVAWLALGVGAILISWRACLHPELFGAATHSPVARVLYFVITFALIGLAVTAGITSYRAWRTFSDRRRLGAEGRDHVACAD